ncbi:hypothetical protein EVAR_45873_1 [Eumeta japonica]|uniref:Uncharacterized protein n=1 Tax=Eumeta variegata TaxID=151549 RepID=A0A4C1WLX7_EUMVA|nr:hypothetical protein EVAR_45873_1 [Eumeta japonica]
MNLPTTREWVVIVTHKHSQPQRRHQCIAGLLDRRRICDRKGIDEVAVESVRRVGHVNSHSLDESVTLLQLPCPPLARVIVSALGQHPRPHRPHFHVRFRIRELVRTQ